MSLTITNEDNMELMKRYPDNYFELAIVDPPYGVIEESKKTGFKGNSYDNTHSSKNWDIKPTKEYFNELKRVSKNQIIWGFQYFIEEVDSTKSIIIWDKMNGENFMNDCELAWTNCKGNNNLFRHAYIGRYHPEPIRIHPTQKPVALYKWLLDKYAKQGDKILDTHLGSMSIAIACADYGFDLVGCELDVDYYNKGIERVNNHTNQTKLF
jgi:site-specific DNA-methyltransferase (adenine-specific)